MGKYANLFYLFPYVAVHGYTRIFVLIGFNLSVPFKWLPLYRTVLVLLLCLLSVTSSAACWQLTDKDGHVSNVLEIWHIRDRFSQAAALLGATNGKELVIPVASLRSISFQPAQRTWFTRLGGVKMTATLEFLDGRTDSFVTDSQLFVQKQSGKEKIPVGNLRSVVRCEPGAQIPVTDTELDRPAQWTEPGVSPNGSPAARVNLSNGDILYGEVTTETFHWKAPYADLNFHGRQIRSLRQPEQGVSQGLLELRSGDRISGALIDSFIEIRLRDGQRVQVPSHQLQSIEFPGVLNRNDK